MASISTDPQGNCRILFVAGDGKHRTIRLSQVPNKDAERLQSLVERIRAAQITGSALDADTTRAVAQLGDVLHKRFVAAGLAEPGLPSRLSGWARSPGPTSTSAPTSRIRPVPNWKSARPSWSSSLARIALSTASPRATATTSPYG